MFIAKRGQATPIRVWVDPSLVDDDPIREFCGPSRSTRHLAQSAQTQSPNSLGSVPPISVHSLGRRPRTMR